METTLQMLEARDYNHLLASRAARVYCHTDKNGQRICRRESFFHRVGRWILTGVLVFFALIFLMILCCCIRRRRSKKAKEAQQGYNAQYAPPVPASFNPPPPPLPIDSKPGQLNGVVGGSQTPALSGAAADYYRS